LPRRLTGAFLMEAETKPVSAAEFAAAMADIGDFEAEPLLILAVSGGADSMALALLADEWARARGGDVLAVTVDHGLRTESAAEAAAVGKILAARGIAHDIATWSAARPASGVEAAARAARYALLTDRCRRAGALHLLTAHHADDQAETVLLRLCRGSGPDGLAGMAPVRNLGDARLLRPLLRFPAARLRAVCRAAGIAWVEDPSNHAGANARSRLRAVAPLLEREGLSVDALNRTGAQAAAQRRLLDRFTADLLARAVMLSPYGFAEVDLTELRAAEEALALRALARVLTTVGGGDHPPPGDGLRRLTARLRADEAAASTLGGCVIRPRDGAKAVIFREAALLPPPQPLRPGERLLWDGRFSVTLATDAATGLRIAPRGPGKGKIPGVPAAAAAALPALIGVDSHPAAAQTWLNVVFAPRHSLAGSPFPVVSRAGDII
jgi:tRNA(Ile)-lysidine synthase